MAYDFGIKTNILRRLTSAGCKVTVVPAAYPAQKVLDMKPDGIFLSNGPVSAHPVDKSPLHACQLWTIIVSCRFRLSYHALLYQID